MTRVSLSLVLRTLSLLVFLVPGTAPGITLSVSPAAIRWDTNTWVDVVVSNTGPQAAVNLALHIDADGNGLVDTNLDYPLAMFRLVDGQTNSLGATIIPDDDDGLTNGVIRTRVSYHGIESLLHTAGSYVWWAANATGGVPATATFTVTRPPGTVWISGRVLNYDTSNAVPCAIVEGQYFSGLHYVSRVLTDTGGYFRLDLPASAKTTDVSAVAASCPRYMRDGRLDSTGSNGVYRFTNDLHSGENVLPVPLFLRTYRSNEVHRVSGNVYAGASNGVSGVLLEFGDDSEMYSSPAISRTNGYFEIAVPHGTRGGISTDDAQVSMRGLMGGSVALDAVTSDVSGIEIHLPVATVLARAAITDVQTGGPVVGVEVGIDHEDQQIHGRGFTLSNGYYEIGVIAGDNYHFTANDLGLLPQGYVPAASLSGLSIPGTGIYSNASFQLRRGYPFSGHVYDSGTVPLTGGNVNLNDWDQYSWYSWANVDRHGGYASLAATGRCMVSTWGFEGCIPVAYSNVYLGEQGSADPVVVTTNGRAGIDFHLQQGALISGTVSNQDGFPVSGAWVTGEAFVEHAKQPGAFDWVWITQVNCDEDGNYRLFVPPGAGCRVRADADGLLSQYYNGVYDYQVQTATIVTAQLAQAVSNINFRMSEGGAIAGVLRDSQTHGLPDDPTCGAIVLSPGWHRFVYRQEEYDGGQLSRAGFMAPGQTDWSVFSISQLAIRVAPDAGAQAGILLVTRKNTWTGHPEDHAAMVACVDRDATNAAGWYGSSVVTAVDQEENIHGNSDYYVSHYEGYFLVQTGGVWRFSTDSDDASEIVIDDQPVAYWYGGHGAAWRWQQKADIRVSRYDTGEFVQSTRGNEDGSYLIDELPPGNYVVDVAAPGYLGQFFHDVGSWDEAEPVCVTIGNTSSNIDFSLRHPSYILGRVTDRDTGVGAGGVWVSANFIPDTNNYWDNWDYLAGTTCDTNGDYSLPVPPGSNYIVRAESGNSFYCFQCWSNTTDQFQAQLLQVPTNGSVSNINFWLTRGMRIEGQVRNQAGEAFDGVWVDAWWFDDYGSQLWASGGGTDNNGNYGFAVPATTNYYVRVPSPDGQWYADTYFSNKFSVETANLVRTNVGSTVRDVNFCLVERYRVQGHVCRSDGTTPAPGAQVIARNAATGQVASASADGSGFYRIYLPSDAPVRLQGTASGYVAEYYNNVYGFAAATPVLATARSTLNLDFSLYGMLEDYDGDGLLDYEEDTTPDGIFNPLNDLSDHTNDDTDGDGLSDYDEVWIGTSPALGDTDRDSFSDWIEYMILGTDPTDRDDCLKTTSLARGTGNVIRVSWKSVPLNYYYVCRNTNMLSTNWPTIRGPLRATSTTTTISDTNPPSPSFYRVEVRW